MQMLEPTHLPPVAVVLGGVDDTLLCVGGVLRVAALPVGVVHRRPVQPVEALRIRVAPTQTDPLLGVVGDPERQSKFTEIPLICIGSYDSSFISLQYPY